MINIYYFDRPDLKDVHMLADLKITNNFNFGNGLKVKVSKCPDYGTKINICVDTGHCLPEAPREKGSSAFWCQHCHTEKHQKLAKKFKFSFGADKHYVNKKLFDFWLPNGVGVYGFNQKISIEPKYDVGFIGQYLGSRKSTLSKIANLCNTFGWSYQFVDTRLNAVGKEGPGRIRPNWKDRNQFTTALKQCKILLNITGHPALQLLNCRIFEGMAVGRPVVSDTVGYATEVVSEGFGVSYFDYNNIDTIVPCIQRLLEDREYYLSVVAKGASILEKHTIRSRILSIIRTLGINV
jgi:hypothetical protein